MKIEKIKKFFSSSDILIEVLDCRMIQNTRFREIEKKYRDKIIVVAAKCDLVENLEEIKKKYPDMYFISNINKEGIEQLKRTIIERAYKKFANKGKKIEVFIFGMPNVGKSSLINSLVGKRVAKSGFRSGITKGIQWIKFNNQIRIIDSPGTITKADEEVLALSASLDAQKVKNPYNVALKIIKKFFELKKQKELFEKFGIKSCQKEEEVIEEIAKKRGLYIKGGELNIDEACKILIREWQRGKIRL
ncbi:MAG: GTPase [Candidatus Anstonellaceae archaeon]